MKRSYFLYLVIVVLLLSCKKNSDAPAAEPEPVNTEMVNGFPQNRAAINGYLFGGFSENSGSYGYLSSYSTFRDPAGDLMSSYDHYGRIGSFKSTTLNTGNVRVGSVRFCDMNVAESSNSGIGITYLFVSNQTSINFDFNPSWQTQGNGSFKAIDMTVPRGFPKIVYPDGGLFLSQANDYTINIKDLVTNFDTVIVSVGSVFTPIVKKVTPADVQSIKFNKEDLAKMGTIPYSTSFFVQTFNYSNKTINGKVYVFELANGSSTTISIMN